MIILGIETAAQQVGCALGGQEGVLGSFQAARGRHHAEILTPAIEFTCKQAKVDYQEISVVAVDVGPGLFTGLRVGVATAKAIAFALRVPMIGLSSLDLLAYPMRWTDRLIVPIIDARRDEIFWSTYRRVSGGVQRLTEFRVGKPEDLVNELGAKKEDVLFVGDGAIRYADQFKEIDNLEFGTVGNAYPSAASLVELAQPRALREEFVQPHELEILYLRKSDAEVNWDAHHGAQGEHN
jgi:tRNA threonylcarbamoyladenosine biosynthesis protein TsaB